jgi:hypothetical protein
MWIGEPSGRSARLQGIVGSAVAVLLIVAGLGLFGCRPAAPPVAESEGGDPEAALWEPVAVEAFDETQRAMLERAELARQNLFGRLMERLQGVMQSDGPVAAIAVCQQAAPQLAAEVASQTGVAIGRTSLKLRNAANQPPVWAGPLMAAGEPGPWASQHSDGRLGVLLPIKLQAGCLMCHGTPGEIPPMVAEAIAERYPDDRAIGFAEGDLRGWFWVEVPTS